MKKKKLIIITTLLVIAVLACFAGIKIKKYLPYYFDKKGMYQSETEYTLTIEKTDFENEVAAKLRDNGIIISSTRFLGYLHKHYPDFVWLNGVYYLSDSMSYKQVCEKLKNPDVRLDYVKITVPEGKNVRAIAKIVSEAGLCGEDEFIKAADSYDYEYGFIEELKKRDSSKIGYKLEGYLFPATYEFRKDTVTPNEIVDKMLSAFDDYVTPEMRKRASEKGLDINGLVTFASVIQAEAFSKDSMKNISSVFWNRLNSSMKRLQSDPTTKYAKSLKELENYSQEMYNAYDTYTCIGLPIAPTNCPGTDVMEAVLEPNETDYYYFVTDADGNFYYNKTYSEHVKKCYEIGLWK